MPISMSERKKFKKITFSSFSMLSDPLSMVSWAVFLSFVGVSFVWFVSFSSLLLHEIISWFDDKGDGGGVNGLIGVALSLLTLVFSLSELVDT